MGAGDHYWSQPVNNSTAQVNDSEQHLLYILYLSSSSPHETRLMILDIFHRHKTTQLKCVFRNTCINV